MYAHFTRKLKQLHSQNNLHNHSFTISREHIKSVLGNPLKVISLKLFIGDLCHFMMSEIPLRLYLDSRLSC